MCVQHTTYTQIHDKASKNKKNVEYGEMKGPSIPKYHMVYTPGNQRLKAGVPLAVCPQASALQVSHGGH